MKSEDFIAFKQAMKLIKIILSNPLVTLRLVTWKRIQNACKALLFQQGNIGLLLGRYKAIYNSDSSKEVDFLSQISNTHIGDVVFFPAIDWGFRFQRPQHLARELGAKGYRVFYISTVPLISATKKGYLVQGAPEPGVVLIQLSSGSYQAPDFYRDKSTKEEQAGIQKSYEALRQNFMIDNPILIIQQPFWWPIVSSLKAQKTIYDCIDLHTGFHDEPNHYLMKCEQKLVNSVDEVVVTSETLAESFQSVRDCHLIRNGCEFDRFSKAVRSRFSSHPIIGYVGAVSEWFDGELLCYIAKERPNWQFNIYGAIIGADISAARALPNVNFFGEISYETVPDVIANFDVCIIPFKLNSLTMATNPVKVYEYLAVGLPVVATKMPELDGLEHIDVFCSDSANKFSSDIEHSLSIFDSPDRIVIRKNWARKNDWSKRAKAFNSLMQGK